MSGRLLLVVVLPFALAYFLSLFFRSINAVVAPHLQAELALSAADLGFLTATYFLAFALFQVPLGVLLDRFGARRVQACLVTIAACGALLFAFGRDMTVLSIGRGLIGLGFSGGLMAAYKLIADWFPKPSLPLLNGCFLGFGSMGALVATAPAQAALEVIGWRGLLTGFAGVTVLVAVGILLIVPERERRDPVPGVKQQLIDLFGVIYRDRLFWRVAPMTTLCFAVGSAIQTLWAGLWLRDVAGFDARTVADYLLVMALALSIGSALGGVIAEALRRHGIAVQAVAGGAAVVMMTAEIFIVLELVQATLLLWTLFAATFNVVTLNYARLSQHFPAEFAGRANTGMNLMSGGLAFIAQYAIGGVINLWPPVAGGGYDPAAYQWAFGGCLAVQLLAFAWFVIRR